MSKAKNNNINLVIHKWMMTKEVKRKKKVKPIEERLLINLVKPKVIKKKSKKVKI
jgi:hypothetical protein